MSNSDSKDTTQNSDYDLSKPLESTVGLRQGLTSYGDAHFSLFLRKVFIKALGYSEDALSRPIVGIVNTYSSFNPCHANIPQLIDAAKRGVQLNGGLAIDFPTISLHESFSSPTSMFLRNLMSMDTEEMIRAQPVDSVILIGGVYNRSCVHLPADRNPTRLRQDDASPADGRHLGQQARHTSRHGTHDARQPQGHQSRRLHRLPQQLGQIPRRHHRHRGDLRHQ